MRINSLIREALKSKSDTFEQDARQAREQLAELTRTATDYSDMIKQREEEILTEKTVRRQ